MTQRHLDRVGGHHVQVNDLDQFLMAVAAQLLLDLLEINPAVRANIDNSCCKREFLKPEQGRGPFRAVLQLLQRVGACDRQAFDFDDVLRLHLCFF